ncbi:MAG: stage II sporulation protein D [Oscillospiraceae bacterium]|nr:stage II sporulation protein D [Oscillospiraceae bacterium]
MREYPSQIPSQRTPRPRIAEPVPTMPRRVANADASSSAAPRQDTPAAPDAAQSATPRADSASRENALSGTRRRTRRRRPAKRESRKHPLHAVLTASAALYLILFLMPLLFTSDSRSSAVTLSGTIRKPPETNWEAQTPEENWEAQTPEAFPQPQAEAVQETFAGQLDEDCYLKVLNRKNDEVSVMSMQEYLVCVLRGEMPGYFELEALKAQAVAARTYTRYMIHTSRKHGDRADICTSPGCCQAYLSAADAKKKWGYLPDDEERKIRSAVIDTDGETMLYDGEPILAVFHASAAGVTRTSSAVWSGDDKPYLQPVSSPENGDNTPNYYSHVDFTLAQLQDKLRSAFPKANLSGDASEWLTGAERDEGGNIITMYVGGIKTQGSKVRSALGLRSACFTWEYADGKASFYVTGYGHGVGLSQYGANQMAKSGSDYRAILTHYYTGVKIGGYSPD